MIPATLGEDVRVVFEGLHEAWKRGDGAGFAAWCTPDVDFVNVLGLYVKGRSAVGALHDKIFHGPYAGSTVAFSAQSMQALSADILLVIAPAEVNIPAGPVQGIVATIATILLVRENERWLIAAFHNTKREATQAAHGNIMLRAIES